ncbi:MAG: hypothetical protein JXR07_04215 [Reichenbachiella sp.]
MGVEIVVPVVLFLSVAAVLIVYRKFANEERLALIDKGSDAKIFQSDSNAKPALRFSLLLIGAGLGILMGNILSGMFREEEAAYFSMIFLFGGFGLLTAYFIEKKSNDKS